MTELEELRERLGKATGPDRELDHNLYRALMATPDLIPGRASTPYLTASIGAAIALVEAKLPEWACGFDKGPKTCIAFVDPNDFADRFMGAAYTAHAPTAPLAILLALLGALLAKEPA